MDSVYAEEMFYNEDYTRSVVLIKQCFFSYHLSYLHKRKCPHIRN